MEKDLHTGVGGDVGDFDEDFVISKLGGLGCWEGGQLEGGVWRTAAGEGPGAHCGRYLGCGHGAGSFALWREMKLVSLPSKL